MAMNLRGLRSNTTDESIDETPMADEIAPPASATMVEDVTEPALERSAFREFALEDVLPYIIEGFGIRSEDAEAELMGHMLGKERDPGNIEALRRELGAEIMTKMIHLTEVDESDLTDDNREEWLARQMGIFGAAVNLSGIAPGTRPVLESVMNGAADGFDSDETPSDPDSSENSADGTAAPAPTIRRLGMNLSGLGKASSSDEEDANSMEEVDTEEKPAAPKDEFADLIRETNGPEDYSKKPPLVNAATPRPAADKPKEAPPVQRSVSEASPTDAGAAPTDASKVDPKVQRMLDSNSDAAALDADESDPKAALKEQMRQEILKEMQRKQEQEGGRPANIVDSIVTNLLARPLVATAKGLVETGKGLAMGATLAGAGMAKGASLAGAGLAKSARAFRETLDNRKGSRERGLSPEKFREEVYEKTGNELRTNMKGLLDSGAELAGNVEEFNEAFMASNAAERLKKIADAEGKTVESLLEDLSSGKGKPEHLSVAREAMAEPKVKAAWDKVDPTFKALDQKRDGVQKNLELLGTNYSDRVDLEQASETLTNIQDQINKAVPKPAFEDPETEKRLKERLKETMDAMVEWTKQLLQKIANAVSSVIQPK